MKLGVVGSRSFTDYDKLCNVLDRFELSCADTIVSGGCCRGADALAERYAKERRIALEVYDALWDEYGRGAGIIRNRLIVKNSDFVVLFWDGSSKGTASTLRFCIQFKVSFFLVWKDGLIVLKKVEEGGSICKP